MKNYYFGESDNGYNAVLNNLSCNTLVFLWSISFESNFKSAGLLGSEVAILTAPKSSNPS